MDVDYRELERELHNVGSAFGAADSHGAACALLAVKPAADPQTWLDEVLGEARAEAGAARLGGLLEEVFETTRAQLADPEMKLELLVPTPDDAALSECVQALARWSQGFMFGVALSGIDAINDLPQDSAELIRDMDEIARAEIPESPDEHDEAALAEIVEYLRAGTFLVREESMQALDRASRSTLH